MKKTKKKASINLASLFKIKHKKKSAEHIKSKQDIREYIKVR